jgi:hypothetical protein
MLLPKRLPRPTAILGHLHVERLAPSLDAFVILLRVLAQLAHPLPLFVQFAAQLLNAPVAMLHFVLKLANGRLLDVFKFFQFQHSHFQQPCGFLRFLESRKRLEMVRAVLSYGSR